MKLIYRCLCLVFGTILGSGCDGPVEPVEYGPLPEYGVPMATVHITGRVVDIQGNPIPGIEVTFAGAGADTTAADGTWAIDQASVVIPCVSDDQTTCLLEALDIDGPANGGPFPAAQVVLDLVQTVPGSGTYNLGTWEQEDVEVVMDDPAVEYGPPPAKAEESETPTDAEK